MCTMHLGDVVIPRYDWYVVLEMKYGSPVMGQDIRVDLLIYTFHSTCYRLIASFSGVRVFVAREKQYVSGNLMSEFFEKDTIHRIKMLFLNIRTNLLKNRQYLKNIGDLNK